MVKGLQRLRKQFKRHSSSYALTGGAACDILFGEAGPPFRATKLSIWTSLDAVPLETELRFVRGSHRWKRPLAKP